MTASKLIDTSIWLDYFYQYKHTDVIEAAEIVWTSAVSVFEIKKKMLKDKVDTQKIEATMNFLFQESLIEPVFKETASLAAELSAQYGLAAVDALIYASAKIRKTHLITRDNDFRGLPDVTVLTGVKAPNSK